MLAVLDMVNDPSHHTPSDSPVTSPCRDCSSPETPTLHLSASACLVEQSDALVCVPPLSSAMSDLPPSGLNHGGMALVQQQLFVTVLAAATFGSHYLRWCQIAELCPRLWRLQSVYPEIMGSPVFGFNVNNFWDSVVAVSGWDGDHSWGLTVQCCLQGWHMRTAYWSAWMCWVACRER